MKTETYYGIKAYSVSGTDYSLNKVEFILSTHFDEHQTSSFCPSFQAHYLRLQFDMRRNFCFLSFFLGYFFTNFISQANIEYLVSQILFYLTYSPYPIFCL